MVATTVAGLAIVFVIGPVRLRNAGPVRRALQANGTVTMTTQVILAIAIGIAGLAGAARATGRLSASATTVDRVTRVSAAGIAVVAVFFDLRSLAFSRQTGLAHESQIVTITLTTFSAVDQGMGPTQTLFTALGATLASTKTIAILLTITARYRDPHHIRS